jgi:DNA-binding beta-propeller fold protein YncE
MGRKQQSWCRGDGSIGWKQLLVLAALLLSGCATTELQLKLEYGIEGVPAENLPHWPQAPEVPRYRYAGSLVGQGNYAILEDDRAGSKKLLYFLVGLDFEDGDPMSMQRPQSGTVDAEGRILITDSGVGGVFVFDEVGQRFGLWRQLGRGKSLTSPVGIVAGADGRVYVADAEQAVVYVLDRTGRWVATLGEGLLTRPTGLALDETQGLLYVADTHGHNVKVFDLEGRMIDILGGRGERQGQFNFPIFVALGPNRIYVTDSMNSRVQILDRAGDVVRTIGERGLLRGNLIRPKGVATDSEGNVYVVESYYDHLIVFSEQGEYLLPIGGEGAAPGQFYLPSGVWIDGRDRVFVADTFNGRVEIFQFLGST